MTNRPHLYRILLPLAAVTVATAFYDFRLAAGFAAGACALALLLLLLLRFLPSAARASDSRINTAPALPLDSAVPDDADADRRAATVSASALLEATMESMREGVLVVDRSMKVVAANRTAQELFIHGVDKRLPERKFASRRLTELTRNPAIHDAFSTALERGERAEVKVETTGTERRTFDIRVAPLRPGAESHKTTLSGSEVQGAVGVFFDITRLELLERVRQEFLSNVSHELRTPLTAILTFVETLEAGAIDDKENNTRFLQIIRRNAARMQSLINDILELSAIEAGTVSVEIEPLRLHNLVGDVFTALAARAGERRIEMRNDVALEAIVSGDRNRLEQMISNLVDNGVKFNSDGGTITVRYKADTARRCHLIEVADTGEGIPPEHLERIFERFYRVDRARSRALGGTGLGLAIVKHLARAHGGEARVRSDATGSTFTIELPAEESNE